MTKIQLDVPSDVHVKIKQLQLTREGKGEKINLKDLYVEVLKTGVEVKEKGAK